MKAFVFPGQGAQFPGMGKDLYETYDEAKEMFLQANHLLNFSITDVMSVSYTHLTLPTN